MTSEFKPTHGEWFDDLDNELYHAGPGASSTYLRRAVSHSPWYAHEIQQRGGTSTPPQQWGTMAHTAILEPDTLESRYLFAPGLKLNTKAGKERFAELEAEAAATGRQLLREDPADIRQLQADVHSHPLVQRILKCASNIERSYYWQDDGTGLLLKRRPDLEIVEWSATHGLIVDLKSAQDCRIPAFSRCIARYGYAQQAAQYVDGFEQHYERPCHFAWIVVESKPPHEVAIHFADRWLPSGDAQYRKAVELVARCERTGNYPRIYGGKAVEIDMPSWAQEIGDDDE